MNRIDAKFAELRGRGEAALIPFITAGDPDLKTTLKILASLENAGADCIELGVPFSDPTADGPTIQRSSERALKNGLTLPAILEVVKQFRKKSATPLILFGYYNPFFRYGLQKFAGDAKRAGVDGVLCVDLPPEESGELKRCLDVEGLDLIFLLAPTSDENRINQVARLGRGFLYYVSVTGITGARRSLDRELREKVAGIREHSSLPIGVGFGISTPKQAAAVAEFADAAVVGSALVAAIEQAQGKTAKAQRAGEFVADLKKAIKAAARKNHRHA
ncbi:MAG TPA: tryptophan synthase subunit alpha [Candidatus Binatia bacterium]